MSGIRGIMLTEEELWEAVVENQGRCFYAASGLPFSYQLKRGRDGSYNRELIIDRRVDSKTLAWSSIRLAFENALKMQGQEVRRPKSLGDIRGISYIYPLLFSFGVIKVPENKAEKMNAGHSL